MPGLVRERLCLQIERQVKRSCYRRLRDRAFEAVAPSQAPQGEEVTTAAQKGWTRKGAAGGSESAVLTGCNVAATAQERTDRMGLLKNSRPEHSWKGPQPCGADRDSASADENTPRAL